MEIRVLWFERQVELPNQALTQLLEVNGAEVKLTHVQTAGQLRVALEGEHFGCAVVVHENADASEWREVLSLLGSARAIPPTVLLLEHEDAALRREALLSGAWHAVPRSQLDLCAAAMKHSLKHAAVTQDCVNMSEALKNAEAILQKNQRSIALGVLLGSIAHEINNPLEGLANLLYLARRTKTDGDVLEATLDRAEAELNRVSEITKQTLSFHRESRTRQEVSVAEVLDGILTLFTAKLRELQIVVDRQYDSAGWMVAYPGQLRQIFVNLISNAVDAMEHGGRLVLRIRERGGSSPQLCISIADTGRGMPRATLKKLGGLFVTTKGEAGTGIGLWVTRQIIQKYDGCLSVYSSQRPHLSGTAFTLCFTPPHAKLTGNTRRQPRKRHESRSGPQQSNEQQKRFG